MTNSDIGHTTTRTIIQMLTCVAVLLYTVSAMAQEQKTRVKKDITYKVVNDSALHLDIYYNEEDSATVTPVVVYIHGGSWIHGDKSWISSYPDRKAMRKAIIANHYRLVSVDYRLANGINYTFKEELEDCRDAIRWLKRNAAKYNIDADNMALWGTSAGAHLSLVTGYEPTDSTQVKCIINNYGPTDLNKLFRKNMNFIVASIAHLVMPKLYKMRKLMLRVFPDDYCTRYSPVNMLEKHSVPTITLHGGKDEIVPVKQAVVLNKLLREKGEDTKLILFPNERHAFPKLSEQDIATDIKESMDFCKKYLEKK